MAALKKYLPRCRIFLLDGKKFRTNLFALFFAVPLQKKTATQMAVLAEILKKHNWQRAAKEAEELYGALWDISVVKKGEQQLLLFSLETLKAVETEAAIAFLRSRIFQPLQEGFFAEEILRRQKKILKQKLEGQRDDKKAYARKRALEETAAGTPYAISGNGYAEELEEITAKSLFLFYREMVEQAEVKIFFCGGKEEKQRVLSLRQDFPGKIAFSEREAQETAKNVPRLIQETAKMEQARVLLGFSADVETERREAALLVLNDLLGGSPDSSLFRQVREERGLCYDIKSFRYPLSPYLFVQAGIQAKDAKEVSKLVLHCVEEWKNTLVSAERLAQAKETILRQYDGLADSPWGMVDFFADRVLEGKEMTTERWMRQIERVDAEEVRRAANHLEWKTVYLISGEEEKDGER